MRSFPCGDAARASHVVSVTGELDAEGLTGVVVVTISFSAASLSAVVSVVMSAVVSAVTSEVVSDIALRFTRV